MPEKNSKPATIDEYIAQYPAEMQRILTKIRAVVKKSAPGAQETISYDMPGFHLNGNLVWFGVFKHHIGFYPKEAGVEAFKAEASAYQGTKSSLHFPLDQPMPYDLIARIVKFRVAENKQAGGSYANPKAPAKKARASKKC